jgi:amino acid permease
MICFYTCSLIITTAKNDKDYVFTLRKYYGNWGWYLGLIGPALLIFGALVAYFNVIVTNIYSVLYYLLIKVFKMEIEYIQDDTHPF